MTESTRNEELRSIQGDLQRLRDSLPVDSPLRAVVFRTLKLCGEIESVVASRSSDTPPSTNS